ncbi:MAG: hypothetical protein JNM62_15470 [Flavobacteriales bacterium]|nr:hypothetical protein [Flavobacteriales bacterium]
MRNAVQRIDTSTASIELIAPRFVEQRYKSDARIVTGVFDENRKARWKVAGGVPCVVLIILPAELQLHTPSTNEDHYRADSAARSIIALAVVAQTMAVNTAAKFYFRYYAQAFEARVFDDEEDARAWLLEELERVPPR